MHEYIAKAITMLRSYKGCSPKVSATSIGNLVARLSQGEFDSYTVRRAVKLPRYEFAEGGWRVAE